MNKEDFYELDYILGKTIEKQGKTLREKYLIKWKNYSD